MNLLASIGIYTPTQKYKKYAKHPLTFINKFSIIVCNYFFEVEVSPNGMAAAWKAVGG